MMFVETLLKRFLYTLRILLGTLHQSTDGVAIQLTSKQLVDLFPKLT